MAIPRNAAEEGLLTIRIVTDSASDLPTAMLAEFGITVVPLYVNFGTHGCRDGVDLSRQEFYANLPTYSPPPTTGVPSPEVFIQIYERLAAEGTTEILSLHISESLSSMVEVARVAAQRTGAIPVTVLDSGQLSMGQGFLAATAARAAAAGQSMQEILALLEDQAARTHTAAALDTLEFLRRSGRMSGVVARVGTLLQLKPILKMYSGHPTVERVRTRRVSIERLVGMIEQHAPLEQVAFLHANVPERAEELRQRVQPFLPAGEIPVEIITPVIGAHIGPGVVGFSLVQARP
jgi:DegV family protein with EDD domain